VKWLLDYGFINVDNDGVTFVKNVKNEDGNVSKILLIIHVDDGLAACGDEFMYKDFIAAMSKDFDLSDSGELKWFLGGKVEQDREKGIVRLSQEQYCNDVLKRFQMSDCTPVDTPCEANLRTCTWQLRTARHWTREMQMWCAIISSSLGRACI